MVSCMPNYLQRTYGPRLQSGLPPQKRTLRDTSLLESDLLTGPGDLPTALPPTFSGKKWSASAHSNCYRNIDYRTEL